MEYEDREPDPRLLAALEAWARVALCTSPCASAPPAPPGQHAGPHTNWGCAVEAELVGNLNRFR